VAWRSIFKALFSSIERNKDAMVADNLVVQNGVIQWNVIFTRPVQDWEIEMVLSFFARLYSMSVRHEEDDSLVWNLSKRGLFEVKSYYEVLSRKDGPSFL
jgi:hypothetical protein